MRNFLNIRGINLWSRNLLDHEYISLTSKNFLILNLWHDDLCFLGYSYRGKLVGNNEGYVCLHSFTIIGVMTLLRRQPLSGWKRKLCDHVLQLGSITSTTPLPAWTIIKSSALILEWIAFRFRLILGRNWGMAPATLTKNLMSRMLSVI